MPKFKLVGSHQRDLASGQMLAPGQVVDLDEDAAKEAHNKTLIDEAWLVAVPDEPQAVPTGKPVRKEQRIDAKAQEAGQ